MAYFSILMSRKYFVWLFLLLMCVPISVFAQVIHGEVMDKETKQALDNVSIENIYTSLKVTTNEHGEFMTAIAPEQLLEFKKSGYKTVHVRIPKGYIPPFFKIGLTKGVSEIRQTNPENRYSYKEDSLRFYEIYKHELDFPKMSALDMIQHPFSAMSKRNNEIWAFQDNYAESEKEKYIDRTFNDNLITKITNLSGDSLRYYKRRFRPAYEQLRAMNDYTFYTYIKKTVQNYRHPDIPRSAQ